MGDPHFLKGLEELRALHVSKGHDYADAGDPLRNYQVSADDNGVPAWRAAQLRLSEKYHRLCNLTRGVERVPAHESLDDTLLDLAAMALIVRSLRAREAIKQHGRPALFCGQSGRLVTVRRPDGSATHTWQIAPPPDAETAQRWQHADPGDEAGS
jgi:hypothetical protein